MTIGLSEAMQQLPLIAILRGIRPAESVEVGVALVDAGFRLIEVPLNSPDPFRSIQALAEAFGSVALVGAGTVLSPGAARRTVEAGGRLIVMPHSDASIIGAAKAAGAFCLPGVATPTEAFAAMAAGADGLKLFPGESLPPAVLKAWKAVIPAEVPLLPVGGITPGVMAEYVAAGAAGFGIGSALYKPGMKAGEIRERAGSFVTAWRAIAA